MSYEQQARLEILSAVNGINSLQELAEFKDVIAKFFADKAQNAIDALWDNGVIDETSIENWGNEHMRTPYGYKKNRS